ncbi:S-adenosyl-L-methionine-dependent methyltransferase [Trichoderma austrokoningii]
MAESGPDPTPYIFYRDHKSSIRLNYQHMLIRKLCDGQLLHPAVHQGIASRSSVRVADVATGTGLWLTELADALPDAQLHGFDISADQYPPEGWLPKNASMHEQDAFEAFPAEFLGSFDVVNLRFFITLLNGKNIRPLLDNLKSLLKPGGFLQWLDFDPRSAKAIAIDPDMHMPRTESVTRIMRKAQPEVDTWILDNSELLKTAGLDPIAYQRIQLRDYLRPIWNHCHIMGMEELSRRASRSTTGGDEMASSLLRQLQELETEFGLGASIDAEWFIMVGQMPGTQE